MTYNYICFFPLIHHQVLIINYPSVLMELNNGLFLIIFSLMTPKLHCRTFLHPELTFLIFLLIKL